MTFLIACLMLIPPGARADDDPEDDAGFAMEIGSILVLDLDVYELDFHPTDQQLLDGWTDEMCITATLSSNDDWQLTIRGTDSTWSGPWDKPVGHIHWRTGSGGHRSGHGSQYRALTQTAEEVASGNPCRRIDLPIFFRVKLNISTDRPGIYEYESILFELSAP